MCLYYLLPICYNFSTTPLPKMPLAQLFTPPLPPTIVSLLFIYSGIMMMLVSIPNQWPPHAVLFSEVLDCVIYYWGSWFLCKIWNIYLTYLPFFSFKVPPSPLKKVAKLFEDAHLVDRFALTPLLPFIMKLILIIDYLNASYVHFVLQVLMLWIQILLSTYFWILSACLISLFFFLSNCCRRPSSFCSSRW